MLTGCLLQIWTCRPTVAYQMTYALAAAAVRRESLLNQTLCPLTHYPYPPHSLCDVMSYSELDYGIRLAVDGASVAIQTALITVI